jgi:phage terminase large subunit
LKALRQANQKPTINLFDPTFPQQKLFVEDPAKLKLISCTRRAGKSMTAAIYLIYEALTNPGCNCLAIGLTRESIKNIIWKDCLRWLDKKFYLKATFNLTELSMTLPNGSIIRLTGVDSDERESLKLLGAKYRLVCVDEGSMYTVDLRNLIYGVLKPAMTDPNAGGQRGTIAMMGTSSNFTRGLFYDVATGVEPGWSVHTWTAHDNPYVAKQWQEELDEIAEQRPLYMQTPQFKQWYLNQWVVDEDKLCYKFNEKKNLYSEKPPLTSEGWTYVLGIDLGWEDDTAFVLSAFHENDPHLYVEETFNKKFMTLPMVEERIKYYMRGEHSPARIIIDGAAKQSIETMRTRTQIPFEFADKLGKESFIELLNSDLLQEKVKIHRSCTNLINEMMSLVWMTEGDKVKLPKKEHPALPNHLCDALLYNWRMCYHYHSEPKARVIPLYSPEWYKKQSEDIWERERERLEQAEGVNNGDWPSEPVTQDVW